jgi:putative membrane protein
VAFVRPLLIVLTFPVTILTLGLFLLVVNALMIALVAWLVPGFHVQTFGAAFWASIVVSLVSWLGSWIFGPKGEIQVTIRRL